MNPAAPTAAVPVPNGAEQYAALKAAVLGAQANTAPGASPLGSFPELDKLYSSAPQLAQNSLKNAGNSYNTGVQVANDAAAASEARAAAAAANDPSKYKQIQKSDGGYAFIDPQGREITASQYAAITGRSPAEVLKNSQNPIDKAFIQDYNQLQDYINNKANAKNDPKAKSAAQAVETQVRKSYGIDLHQANPTQVIQAFQLAYPTVFGGTAAGAQGNSTLLPSANTIAANKKAAGKSSVSAKAL